MAQEVVPHVADVAVRLAVLEERMAGVNVALALQAKEYERRLLDLNHAHEKQVEDQSTYVSLDKFEGFEDKVNEWQSRTQIAFATMGGREKGGERLTQIVMMVVGAAVGYVASKLGGGP